LTQPARKQSHPQMAQMAQIRKNEICVNLSHLRIVLQSYADNHNESRNYLALEKNSPVPRHVEARGSGKVIALPQVGGLHHRHRRAA
jgi:putative transposase